LAVKQSAVTGSKTGEPAQEVQTQILLACRLGFIDEVNAGKVLSLSNETARIINGLLSFLDRED